MTSLSWPRVGMRVRRSLKTVFVYALLVVGSVPMLLPFLWMISTSLKKQMDVFVFPPQWIPAHPQWGNFVYVFTVWPFGLFILNSLEITLLALIGYLASSSLVGFAFARLRAPGRDALFLLVLASMMLPAQITMVPTYILFSRLPGQWVDSFKPLIVPAYFGNAFLIFLFRQFMLTISPEIEDAARIDGCSSFGVYRRIMLPLSRPVIITAGIFAFMYHWNDFMGPLIYINSESKRPVALALAYFSQNWYQPQLHWMMSASLIVLLPCLMIFFFLQRYFVQGVVFTGVKG